MGHADNANWAAIVGKWTEKSDIINYVGPASGARSNFPFGLFVSDKSITEGKLSVDVRVPDNTQNEGRLLIGYRSPTERYLMAGLRGWGYAYTIGEFVPGHGWRALATAGDASGLNSSRFHRLDVTIHGQGLSLSVNGVKVLDHVLEKPLVGGQAGLFAWGNGGVEFKKFHVAQKPGEVFVVMQFSEPYQQLYEEVIKPVSERFGLKAYHVGEKFGPGMILQDIAQGIIDATIVVAEITPTNQNVFYELGYAHALRKPTIMLAEKGKQLPFDISGYRVLFYENTIAGKRLVEENFKKHLGAIFRE